MRRGKPGQRSGPAEPQILEVRPAEAPARDFQVGTIPRIPDGHLGAPQHENPRNCQDPEILDRSSGKRPTRQKQKQKQNLRFRNPKPSGSGECTIHEGQLGEVAAAGFGVACRSATTLLEAPVLDCLARHGGHGTQVNPRNLYRCGDSSMRMGTSAGVSVQSEVSRNQRLRDVPHQAAPSICGSAARLTPPGPQAPSSSAWPARP